MWPTPTAASAAGIPATPGSPATNPAVEPSPAGSPPCRPPPAARRGRRNAPTTPTAPTATAPRARTGAATAPSTCAAACASAIPVRSRSSPPRTQRRIAADPRPQRSRRRPGLEKPPPEPFGGPASPAHPPHAHAGGSPPQARRPRSVPSTGAAPPATSDHHCTAPVHTGNPTALVPPSPTPLVIVCESANPDYLPDKSGPTGNFTFLDAQLGALGAASVASEVG